jgi:hypothetical protein
LRLNRAREALERADRLLNALTNIKDDDVTGFRDAVPYVLAQLDLINSIIDEDSRRHRTPAFSTWWNGQHPLKDALHELRNAELKQQEQSTGLNATVQAETIRAVVEDGKLRNLPPDPNSQLPRARMYWTFTSGGFAGQEVIPTLRHYYDHLMNSVIPTAESLLS